MSSSLAEARDRHAWRGVLRNTLRVSLVEHGGFVHTPVFAKQKTAAKGRFSFGGEGGIRTLVTGFPVNTLSRRAT